MVEGVEQPLQQFFHNSAYNDLAKQEGGGDAVCKEHSLKLIKLELSFHKIQQHGADK
jgi:hypothetical protein